MKKVRKILILILSILSLVSFVACNEESDSALYFKQSNLTVVVGQTVSSNLYISSEVGSVIYSIDNPMIATVDNSGNVTGVAKGYCILSATAGGKTVKCNVIVKNANQSEIEQFPYLVLEYEELSLNVSDVFTVAVNTFIGEDEVDSNIQISVDGTDVINATLEGKNINISAISKGNAVITVVSECNGKILSKTISVNVVSSASLDLSANALDFTLVNGVGGQISSESVEVDILSAKFEGVDCFEKITATVLSETKEGIVDCKVVGSKIIITAQGLGKSVVRVAINDSGETFYRDISVSADFIKYFDDVNSELVEIIKDGEKIAGYSISAVKDKFFISNDYIELLKEKGVKAVKIWFKLDYSDKYLSIVPISNLPERPNINGVYEWMDCSDWKVLDLGNRVGVEKSNYIVHFNDTVISVDELDDFNIAWENGLSSGKVFIESFVDEIPAVTGAEFSSRTEVIDGNDTVVYTVNIENNASAVRGFGLSDAYLDELRENGINYVSIKYQSDITTYLTYGRLSTNEKFDQSFSWNTPQDVWTDYSTFSTSLQINQYFSLEEMKEFRIYGLVEGQTINNGKFEFYIVQSETMPEPETPPQESSAFTGAKGYVVNVDGPDGSNIEAHSLIKDKGTFSVNADYIAQLETQGVKAVKLWFTGGAIFQTYPYKEGMEWLPFDSWTAYDAGIRANKAENWVGSTQYYYHYSETVFTLEDLATLQIAWMGEPTTATAYIETFTDNVPVITGVEYTTRTETIGDEEVVVYSVNVKDNALKVPAYGLMRGFGLSKAYLAQLAEEDIYSVKIMMKTSGMYLHPHSGDSSPTDHGWWANTVDGYELLASSEQTLTDVVDYRIYALVHESTPAMSDGEVFEFYIIVE